MEKAKILIVEDEAIIAMEIESQLQSLGYEVTSIVDTGEKAIEKAKEDKPNLILMDIRIKGEMDGIKAAEVIRNRFDIPVIFSTAYLDEERIERAKITMPFGYVLKPIQERDLRVTIEMALYISKVDSVRKKSEEWFSTTLKSIGDAVIATDTNSNVTLLNPVAESLTGWSQKDAHGKPLEQIFNIINEGTRETVKNPVNIVIKTGNIVGLANHTILVAKDGKEIPIDDSGSPIRNDKGEIYGVVLVFRDITERKQAEEDLRQSEERFRTLFENIQDGFALHELVYDENQKPVDYKFLEINSSFERLTGLKKEEIIGKRVTEALPGIENDSADWIGTYAKVVINNEPFNFEQFSELLNKRYSCRAFKNKRKLFCCFVYRDYRSENGRVIIPPSCNHFRIIFILL